jgi:hypothetical protein
MKKIYVFAAVLALLTLSLNAQMLPYKAVGKLNLYQDKGKPSSTAGLFRAPAKINTADGEFLVGPYNTDDFSTTGKGLYSTTSYGQVEVSTEIPRSEVEQYIGQEIVGYRFATIGTVSCYAFLVEGVGPNYYIDDLYTWNLNSSGSYVDQTGSQWHEFYLDEPVVFQLPDTTTAIWIGYRYYQESSSYYGYTSTPIAVNPNVTNYLSYAYSYRNESFYDVTSTLGGAVAAQLIFKNNTNPSIAISPEAQTINDAAAGTLTITGTNIEGNINASLANNTDWYLNPTSLSNTGGDVSVSYTGRALTASNTVTAMAANDNTVTATATVNYVADLYIVGDFGNGWNFSDNTHPMSYNNGTYTATLTVNANNYILFARLLGNDNPWGSRDVFGPVSDGNWVMPGDNAGGNLNLDGSNCIHFPEGGTYTITIDANNGTFTITRQPDGQTATPVITSEVVDGNVVITATGDGTVTLTVDGQSATGEGSVSITIPCGTEERTVTATATAQEAGKEVSDEATASITIPEAGRSPKPTINYSWDGDVCTITATGTGDVHMYVDGVEVTQPYVVEKGSVERTITVTATNQETGLAISHEAEQEIVIPTINMSGFTQLNPQPANADAPIDLSKLMFVDRFSVEIPEDNSHPLRYDYTLEETQAAQRQSNTVPVFAEHTGSNGLGFYTLDQIKSDSIPSLKMNVMNAAMDFNLSPTSDPYFYTVEREDMGSNNEPYWDWTAVLQRTSDGKYKETKRPLYNYDSIYPPGPHVQLDLDTITGDYNDYKAYVPVVWTMGFDRVNYPVDETHNSYGAHVWRTGVAKAEVVSVTAERQSGMHTTWNDGTADCSLYFLKIHAKGYMPTANTLKYVPYMFRVFVKSKTGKLRGFVPVNNTNGQGQHPENDPNFDNFTGPLAIWDEYVDLEDYDGSTIVDFYKWETDTTEWTKNIMFAATDDLTGAFEQGNTSPIDINDLEVFVRFYYVVPGMLPAPNSLRAGGGNGPAGYGAQSPGKGPDPSTDIVEVFYNHGAVESRVYYNMQGVRSDKPFDGINVVVTRYMDGTTTTTKVVR